MSSTGNKNAFSDGNRAKKSLPEVSQDRKNASSFSKCCLAWPKNFLCFLVCSRETDEIKIKNLWELEDHFAGDLRERIADVWDQKKLSHNDKDPNLVQVLWHTFWADIFRTIIWHLFYALVTVIELVPLLFFFLKALKDLANAHLNGCSDSCAGKLRAVLTLSVILFFLECLRAYSQAKAR